MTTKTYRATIYFEIDTTELKHEPSEQQIENWVAFAVGARAQLEGDNPLVNQDLEAYRVNIY